jgi:predicted short-subunit dehydrogenase-like oxidoreductase (DUF2520 family)
VKVAIIGAGVLGTSLGILLHRKGYEIAAIASRNRRSAQETASRIGQGEVVGDPGLAAMGADIVLLAVPDHAVTSVSLAVAAGGALRRGAVVAHLAGGLPASVLSGVDAAGAWRGSFHPLQTFADVETALRLLPETHFFLEGDAEAVEVLRAVALRLGGRPVLIDASAKALYHAGASAASNFVVTLVDYAVTLLCRAGVPKDAALAALLPLVRGTVANLEAVGLPDALTGPIARGDTETVARHLEALADLPGDVLRVYRSLARKTIELAVRKGSITTEQGARLLEVLYGREELDGPGDEPG